MGSAINALLILAAMLSCGAFIGIGIALGVELAMRISGDGRTVILTWAKTKHEASPRDGKGDR